MLRNLIVLSVCCLPVSLCLAGDSPLKFVQAWGKLGKEPGEFHSPIGIAINAKDELYVAEFRNNRVQKFSAEGKFLLQIPVEKMAGGVAVDRQNRIYVAPLMSHKICVYDESGKLPREWGKEGKGDGEFDQPGGIAIAADGTVYVADQVNRRVQHFTPEGKFLGKWGEYGSKPGQFDGVDGVKNRTGGPHFLAFDSKGNIYTTEGKLGRVQKFTPYGNPLLAFGSNSTEPGGFGGRPKNLPGPIGIAIDRWDRIWVSSTNNRVQCFSPEGKYLFGAESLTPGDQPGQFHTPHALVFDSRDFLYVVDAQNQRVQKFSVPVGQKPGTGTSGGEVRLPPGQQVVAHRVLAADRSTGKLAIISTKGDVEWEYPNKHDVHDLHLLPNGNILTHTSHTTVVEIDRSKQIVWRYEAKPKPGYTGKVEVHAFQRLADGRTMIAESGNARIIEVDAKGMIVKEVPLKVQNPHPHRDTRMVRKLSSGNYLACHEGDGCVREYDGNGKVVWEYRLDLGGKPRSPGHGPEGHGIEVFGAVRLTNGNTLIAGGNNNRVLEVNAKGEIVWKIDQQELPGITLAWVTTLQVLPNGNIVIGNCHAGPENPQLIEVTRDKKVVWTFRDFKNFGDNLAAAQVLDVEGNVIR